MRCELGCVLFDDQVGYDRWHFLFSQHLAEEPATARIPFTQFGKGMRIRVTFDNYEVCL